jgi:hypothetical protein
VTSAARRRQLSPSMTAFGHFVVYVSMPPTTLPPPLAPHTRRPHDSEDTDALVTERRPDLLLEGGIRDLLAHHGVHLLAVDPLLYTLLHSGIAVQGLCSGIRPLMIGARRPTRPFNPRE